MSEASDRTGCISAARSGTLAGNDQRLQAIRRRAGQGVREDQQALEEITEAGGTNGGQVGSVV
jgi:hypothetical protein